MRGLDRGLYFIVCFQQIYKLAPFYTQLVRKVKEKLSTTGQRLSHVHVRPMAGHPPEQQEHERRLDRVKQQADQVMARRLQSEELPVQHVRNPHCWMPVGPLAMQPSRGPIQALLRQPGLDIGVAGHVIRIVVFRKLVPGHRPEGCERERRKQQSCPKGAVWHARRNRQSGGR